MYLNRVYSYLFNIRKYSFSFHKLKLNMFTVHKYWYWNVLGLRQSNQTSLHWVVISCHKWDKSWITCKLISKMSSFFFFCKLVLINPLKCNIQMLMYILVDHKCLLVSRQHMVAKKRYTENDNQRNSEQVCTIQKP